MVESGTPGAITVWLTGGENFLTTSLFEEAEQVRLGAQLERLIDTWVE